MKLLFSAVLALLALVPCTSVHAQDKVQGRAHHTPVINKVDPPNWWISLPAPMLLIHGENLNGATVHVVAHGVTVAKQQASPNGHWIFVWLSTAKASPQTIKIVARNTAGSASYDFALKKRQISEKKFPGFSPT